MGRAAVADRCAAPGMRTGAGKSARILPRQDAGLVHPRSGNRGRQHSAWRDGKNSQVRIAPALCRCPIVRRSVSPAWPRMPWGFLVILNELALMDADPGHLD